MNQILDTRALSLLLPVLAAGAATVIVASDMTAMSLLVFPALLALGVGAFLIPADKVFFLYLVYMVFEGAAKILTNYNSIIHVSADLLLILCFVRLWHRKVQENFVTPDMRGRDRFVLMTLVVFWLWVAVQFVNPWGIGFIPSLSSLKVYAVPMLVFFIVCYLLKKSEIEKLPYIVLLLGLIAAGAGVLDGFLGDSYLPTMHFRYSVAMKGAFQGDLYRPFGTTAVPGGPSIWVIHCLVGALLVWHLRSHAATEERRQRWSLSVGRIWSYAVLAFLVLGFTTIAYCQVRSALVRFALLGALGLLLAGRRGVARLSVIAVLAVMLGGLFVHGTKAGWMGEDSQRYEQLISRFEELKSRDTWTSARSGNFRAMGELGRQTLYGIGLARVGAMAGKWKHVAEREPHFGAGWSAPDNVYRALFTELGIFGLAAYVLVMLAVLVCLVSVNTYPARLAAVSCLVFFITGLGSEGILYSPDSLFYWLYAGLGLRLLNPWEADLSSLTLQNKRSLPA